MKINNHAQSIINAAYTEARMRRHEYLTPEHILYAALNFSEIQDIFKAAGANLPALKNGMESYFQQILAIDREPTQTVGFQNVIERAVLQSKSCQKEFLGVSDILVSLFDEENNHCAYFLRKFGVTRFELLRVLAHGYDGETEESQKFFRADRVHANNLVAADDDGTVGDTQKKSSKRSALERYATELTALARDNRLEPVIGREAELDRTIQVLCRRLKNNPIHVGDSGVGKTAITEGIAQRIAAGAVPPGLRDFALYSLDMGSLIAGTRFRGDFEERIKKVVEEVQKKEKAILFIDEIHTVVGAGSASGSALDASNLLKPALTTGKLRCIGSTTHEEYKKYISKDHALSRRFQKIDIEEPSEDDAIQILAGLKSRYEEYHNVRYTDEAVGAAVRLSAQYITERRLPDKAVDVLDEAGAAARIQAWRETSGKQTSSGVSAEESEREDAAEKKRFLGWLGKPARTAGSEQQARGETVTIGLAQIETVVAHIAKVPERSVGEHERDKLRYLEDKLRQRVFGQDEAVSAVVKAVKRSRAGFRAAQKPVANVLFAGPTGVGKTELAKNLAELLGLPLHRFDMSEYQEKHTISRLIGSPPGYVGYEEGGLLTETVRKQPHCVLLLDEIEKAHADIYNILLQIMDYATLTDNNGRKADFRNAILIMTSNAGAREIGQSLIGFGERIVDHDSAVNNAVEKIFTPEFRNRLDTVVKFGHLSKDIMLAIVDKELEEFRVQLAEKNVSIRLSDSCREHLAEDGYSKEFGARNSARIIEEKIKTFFVDEVLFGRLSKGGFAAVDWSGGMYHFTVETAAGVPSGGTAGVPARALAEDVLEDSAG
ncbi:MAG: ATP-dependent Clp protease ATP-binding subunit ClpA [Spirochaetaceae bacterium]|jgi:ATP-dependent Clp protease ATP-binding subunit ClpA|nr:ATP-dependent Clp protease ATP-binding subunit ClpA [Spirochaetaceae bacterium]